MPFNCVTVSCMCAVIEKKSPKGTGKCCRDTKLVAFKKQYLWIKLEQISLCLRGMECIVFFVMFCFKREFVFLIKVILCILYQWFKILITLTGERHRRKRQKWDSLYQNHIHNNYVCIVQYSNLTVMSFPSPRF